ncbi:MAG: 5'/3'-nucleotidase SurE [Elainellaceae cyanobacterium]
MTIILTNDDGIDAPGIRALQNALNGAGKIVAPSTHQSGCSHQLTTGRPIKIERRSTGEVAIAAMPADCARIAVKCFYPDATWVLSGINAGGNLGADVPVSGTVAAVREAAYLRIPGIAISHYIHRGRTIDWDIASRLTAKVIDTLMAQPHEVGTFWNVNLPHLTPDDPDPELVMCSACTQPLPTDYDLDGDTIQYAGSYGDRDRDPGGDVDVCFSGKIAVTKIQLW